MTVTHQVRAIGVDRWVTDGLKIYGPFYNRFTAAEFARKVGRGAIRVRYTMFEDVDFDEQNGALITLSSGGHKRTIVATSAIQPSSVRAAWRNIRDWYGDKPIQRKRKDVA